MRKTKLIILFVASIVFCSSHLEQKSMPKIGEPIPENVEFRKEDYFIFSSTLDIR